jgi:hypothetical protein
VSIAWCNVEDQSGHQIQVIPCLPSDTVSSIATAVSLQTAIPSDQLVFWLNDQTLEGQTLNPNATLASYAITPGTDTIVSLVSPTITSVTRGDNTLTVTWNSAVGTNNFGQNTGYYLASASPGSAHCDTSNATTNSCVIDGVSNTQAYSIVVTAVNPGKLPNVTTAAMLSAPTASPTTTTQQVTTSTQPSLPSTGSNLQAPLLFAPSLIILGAVGLTLARRARTRRR